MLIILRRQGLLLIRPYRLVLIRFDHLLQVLLHRQLTRPARPTLHLLAVLLVYDDGLGFLAVLLGHLGGCLVELLLQRLSGGWGFHPFLLVQRLQS